LENTKKNVDLNKDITIQSINNVKKKIENTAKLLLPKEEFSKMEETLGIMQVVINETFGFLFSNEKNQTEEEEKTVEGIEKEINVIIETLNGSINETIEKEKNLKKEIENEKKNNNENFQTQQNQIKELTTLLEQGGCAECKKTPAEKVLEEQKRFEQQQMQQMQHNFMGTHPISQESLDELQVGIGNEIKSSIQQYLHAKDVDMELMRRRDAMQLLKSGKLLETTTTKKNISATSKSMAKTLGMLDIANLSTKKKAVPVRKL
jgi:hypothetical protein